MRSVVALVMVVLFVNACVPPQRSGGTPTCVPAPHEIISWYPGEGDARDVVSSNDGTADPSVGFGPGKVGQAFQFQGQQVNGVDLGDVTAFNFNPTSSFAIEAWVNLNTLNVASGNDGMVIVSLNYRCTLPTPATETLGFQVVSPGSLRAFFQLRDDTGAQVIVTSGPVAAHQWIHLVAVRDTSCPTGKEVRLFMNGALVMSQPDTTAGFLHNQGPDYIGRRFPCNTNNPFNGIIDEVTIYGRALTECEIAALYGADCAGKCGLSTCVPTGCGC